MKHHPIAFSGGPFNHAETQRSSDELAGFKTDLNARVIMFEDGALAMTPADMKTGELPALIYTHPTSITKERVRDPGLLFLGLSDDGPLFAVSLNPECEKHDTHPAHGASFEALRMVAVAGQITGAELASVGRAKSLLDWHKDHIYCAKCGQATQSTMGGMKRICAACETEHFPRVNPVVIMLVIHKSEHGERCVLGRGHGWPEGAYSALAGYVSPGETIEEACRREVWEEVGLTPHSISYMMSQPWPWPSQLMIGLRCYVDTTELNINTDEIETAQWFDKDTIKAVFNKRSDAFKRPPRFTIAHQLLRAWVTEDE